jgi:hypothetical protein
MTEEAGQADDDRAELMAQLTELREKYEASQVHGRWQERLIVNLQQQRLDDVAATELSQQGAKQVESAALAKYGAKKQGRRTTIGPS